MPRSAQLLVNSFNGPSRIRVVSALGRFGQGRFGLGRFGQFLGWVVSALVGGWPETTINFTI